MKSLSKICAALAAVVLLASCGSMGTMATNGTGTGLTVGTTNGQASGAALKNLYTQYKTDGKVDLNNVNNLMNMVALATGIQGLKGQTDKSAFYTDFAAGLILGSNNLVNKNTSSAVTGLLGNLVNGNNLNALTSLAGNALTNAANNAATNATSPLASITEKTEGVASTISTLSSIFGMLK